MKPFRLGKIIIAHPAILLGTVAIALALPAPPESRSEALVLVGSSCMAGCNARFDRCLRRNPSDVSRCCDIPPTCVQKCLGSEDTPDHATIGSYVKAYARCFE